MRAPTGCGSCCTHIISCLRTRSRPRVGVSSLIILITRPPTAVPPFPLTPCPGSSASGASFHDLLEVENLLESYFMMVDGTLAKLSGVGEYIDDTEDYINIELDYNRNRYASVHTMQQAPAGGDMRHPGIYLCATVAWLLSCCGVPCRAVWWDLACICCSLAPTSGGCVHQLAFRCQDFCCLALCVLSAAAGCCGLRFC